MGGYDRSRFIPNNVSFFLAQDISRDLVVGLQSITTTDSSGSKTPLLSSPIFTFIDSTIPYIYLPYEACVRFEKKFGLTFDNQSEFYWINDTTHESLLNINPNFTFTIGDSKNSKNTVDIVLPYASFDLVAKPPLTQENSRYFPLQRAANESQYTLGRTFLQERLASHNIRTLVDQNIDCASFSYLIMNYEHKNFSVFQSRFEEGLEEDIVAIPPKSSILFPPPAGTGYNHSSSTSTDRGSIIPSHLGSATVQFYPSAATSSHDPNPTSSTNATQLPSSGPITRVVAAGIVFGVVAFLIVGFLIVFFVVQRWRFPSSNMEEEPSNTVDDVASIMPIEQESLQEIATNSLYGLKEMPDSGKAELQGEGTPAEYGRNDSELAASDSVMFRHHSHQNLTEILVRDDSKATRRFAVYMSTESISRLWVRRWMVGTPNKISFDQIEASQLALPKSLHLGRSLPSTPLHESPRTRWKSF